MSAAFALGASPLSGAASGATAAGRRGDASPAANGDGPRDFDRMLQSQPQPASPGQSAPSKAAAKQGASSVRTSQSADAAQPEAAEGRAEETAAGDTMATGQTDGDQGDPVEPETAAGADGLPAQLLALLGGIAPAVGDQAGNGAAALAEAVPDGAAASAPSLPSLPMQNAAGVAPAPAQSAPTQALPSGAIVVASDDHSGGDVAAMTAAMAAPVDAETETGLVQDVFELPAGTDAPSSSPIQTMPAPATASATRATAAAPSASLQTPVDLHAGFDDGLGSRIVWMAEQRLGQAEIRVTPEHLGPIDVRLQLDGTRVSAEFQTAQPEVRHALETSIPRLRELLGQQGLQLAHADVGQRHSHGGQAAPSVPPVAADGDASPAQRWQPAPLVHAGRGLVDEYA